MVTPWHVGSDHPAELALTLILAFGPFIVLGGVVVFQRRRDAQEEAVETEAAPTREGETPEA